MHLSFFKCLIKAITRVEITIRDTVTRNPLSNIADFGSVATASSNKGCKIKFIRTPSG